MGKTWSRNPHDENYRGDMKKHRKANRDERKARRKAERQLDENMERDEDDVNIGDSDFNQRGR